MQFKSPNIIHVKVKRRTNGKFPFVVCKNCLFAYKKIAFSAKIRGIILELSLCKLIANVYSFCVTKNTLLRCCNMGLVFTYEIVYADHRSNVLLADLSEIKPRFPGTTFYL